MGSIYGPLHADPPQPPSPPRPLRRLYYRAERRVLIAAGIAAPVIASDWLPIVDALLRMRMEFR